MAGSVQVYYLSPRVKGAMKCCSENSARKPLEQLTRGPSAWRPECSFLSLPPSPVFCLHSSPSCQTPCQVPIIICFQEPSLPFLNLLAVERQLALVQVLALPRMSCMNLGKTLTFRASASSSVKYSNKSTLCKP